ncbi:hypothetical protein TIFTF001_031304 [Ficus carica]|uniref:Uncharacterized protein n=1 Tax=Ficus carica TaxID=3494 RepID=A0AA88J5A5_FICCA|nr:hypothetical protein TIFTF001_031304 [Ficus carica]
MSSNNLWHDSGGVALRKIKRGIAKYFPNSDFVNASLNSNASYASRSIVWGRDLLSKGLRWIVGNGLSMKAFSNPRISRPYGFKPLVHANSFHPDRRVADLIHIARWNMDVICSSFHMDCEAILSIPLGR